MLFERKPLEELSPDTRATTARISGVCQHGITRFLCVRFRRPVVQKPAGTDGGARD